LGRKKYLEVERAERRLAPENHVDPEGAKKSGDMKAEYRVGDDE
jgi:hypothetical protein